MTHDEIMGRVFVADPLGNVFSLPIGPEHNAKLAAGEAPEGFEMVFAASMVNPKYAHILASAMSFYQMAEQAKIMFEAHSDQLAAAGTPATAALAGHFEQMAANLNLAQRQAREGLRCIVDNKKNFDE